MNEVTEFELWSKPENNFPEELGEQLADKISKELGLEKDIVLGLSFVSDDIDVENLKIALSENEITTSDFDQYCKLKNISNDINNKESASLFLEYIYGRPLTWLHIPSDEKGDQVFLKLKSWINKSDFIIVEPEEYYCLITE